MKLSHPDGCMPEVPDSKLSLKNPDDAPPLPPLAPAAPVVPPRPPAPAATAGAAAAAAAAGCPGRSAGAGAARRPAVLHPRCRPSPPCRRGAGRAGGARRPRAAGGARPCPPSPRCPSCRRAAHRAGASQSSPRRPSYRRPVARRCRRRSCPRCPSRSTRPRRLKAGHRRTRRQKARREGYSC